MTLGVGLLGAGPATQAIHLPTLARLGELFRTVHVMDVDHRTASSVAARVGATTSTSANDLLADPEVDVVAVCSPPQFHAEQVEAACRAGVRAVLCEKPFATSAHDAERLAAVAAETGVPIVVGAMHLFDPAWRWASQATDVLRDAHSIRSRIVLPPNRRYEDASTELVERPERAASGRRGPEFHARFLEAMVLGLVIHDLPLVRLFAPELDEVLYADVVEPAGYAIVARCGTKMVEFTGSMNDCWKPDWMLRAASRRALLEVEFTPSYVHAGAGRAVLTTAEGTQQMPFRDSNGYEGEWRHVAELAHAGRVNTGEIQAAIGDLRYAVSLAEACAAHVQKQVTA